MAPDEVQMIDQRVAVQSSLDAMTKVLQADPTFGGLWLDQHAGGEIVVETTGVRCGCA